LTTIIVVRSRGFDGQSVVGILGPFFRSDDEQTRFCLVC
jgi:hypothetical protein